jgi:ABC-type branched-subunit amino acid transport system substrate-binding protein
VIDAFPRRATRGARLTLHAPLLTLVLLHLLTACAAPKPVVKIALVAPFEGRFREVGYDAFPALRLALREQIRAGGVAGYEVEFVAYNDNADPALAERVARDVVVDPRVVAVIGHWRADTTLAALHVYTQAGLAVLAPGVPADAPGVPANGLVFRPGPAWSTQVVALGKCGAGHGTSPGPDQAPQPFASADAMAVTTATLRLLPDFQTTAAAGLLGPALRGLCFASAAPYPRDLPAAAQALAAFPEVSGGFAPGPRSIAAYDMARLLLQAIRADIQAHGAPTRAGVAQALSGASYDGLLGRITFDAAGVWTNAPVWVYRYETAADAKLVR